MTIDLGLQINGKFVSFSVSGKSKSGKTLVWEVHASDSGDFLGQARWFGRWRQYCYFQADKIVMSSECLTDIADFLERQNREHRDNVNLEKDK